MFEYDKFPLILRLICVFATIKIQRIDNNCLCVSADLLSIKGTSIVFLLFSSNEYCALICKKTNEKNRNNNKKSIK